MNFNYTINVIIDNNYIIMIILQTCMHDKLQGSVVVQITNVTPCCFIQALQVIGLIFISMKGRECHFPLRYIECSSLY